MKVCEDCKAVLDDEEVCSCATNPKKKIKLKNPLRYRTGFGDIRQTSQEIYETGMLIVPECISPDEGEIPVKQYNIAILRNLLRGERAEGRVQITNKRVIFRATGNSIVGKTTLQQEFAISEIGGIEARLNGKFNFLYLFFALIIASISAPFLLGTLNGPQEWMNPQHVRQARMNERRAIEQTREAEAKLTPANNAVQTAKAAVATAEVDARDGIQRTRRQEVQVPTTDWWGRTYNRTETRNVSYRCKTPASMQQAADNLERAKATLSSAEGNLLTFQSEVNDAKAKELQARKKRVSAERGWAVFMTIVGLMITIAGVIPYFRMRKKWGWKILFLGFSSWGVIISSIASSFFMFYILFLPIAIFEIRCLIYFVFRPNLVFGIRNKSGLGDPPVDIRREPAFNIISMFTVNTDKGTGFSEIIPTDESEIAIKEAYAIISDIQKLGDFAIEKWKN
jgi:hypothetical protein